MSYDSGLLRDDLQKIVTEFEKLVKGALGNIGGREFRQGARVADRYVRDHTWAAVAVAAAAAFVVGVMMSRRK